MKFQGCSISIDILFRPFVQLAYIYINLLISGISLCLRELEASFTISTMIQVGLVRWFIVEASKNLPNSFAFKVPKYTKTIPPFVYLVPRDYWYIATCIEYIPYSIPSHFLRWKCAKRADHHPRSIRSSSRRWEAKLRSEEQHHNADQAAVLRARLRQEITSSTCPEVKQDAAKGDLVNGPCVKGW